MIKLVVDSKHDSKKILNIIQLKYPKCSLGTIHRAFRNKDIKVNGSRIKEDMLVHEGDELEVYISDELLFGTNSKATNNLIDKKRIVYEDDNILIYNKPQEIEVQGMKTEKGLEEFLNEYLDNI